ncbi:MAG: esterase [Acidobacteria bacterium]|nr:esterase [Acidobacteriota bacterium]
MMQAAIQMDKRYKALALLVIGASAVLPPVHRAMAQAAQRPAYNPTNPTPAVPQALPSISVGADHRVTFRIHAPEARTVTVNGDFLLGAPPASLTKGDDGTWTYTSPPLTPDTYTYNFTVDGVGVLDSSNQNFRDTPNALFNFFDMPDRSTDFMALKDVPHGRVEAIIYHSATLKMERRAHVYLPPNYQDIHTKLPVLYLLHGVGDNDISWTSAGKINLILDNLYAAGKVKNMIVVMPSGHIPGVVHRTMQPEAPGGDPFSDDFLHDLMPYVAKTYNVSTTRDDTAIAGFSMGGVQTLNLALWHPEIFGYVFPMSTGYFPSSIQQMEIEDKAVLEKVARHPFKLMVTERGKSDTLIGANDKATIQMLDDFKIPHRDIALPGIHSFVPARRFLCAVFPLMFQSTAPGTVQGN